MNVRTGEFLYGEENYDKFFENGLVIPVTYDFYNDLPSSIEFGVMNNKSEVVSLCWISNLTDEIKVQIKEYDKLYSDKLNNEDRKLLKLFTKDKYNFLIALRKAFYPKRYRRKITDEISVRILFIFGKL